MREDEFVALKFDVDELPSGSTMEWGFLAALASSPQLVLVDELFIELHATFPRWPGSNASLHAWGEGFSHGDHSSWQGFDVLRELRRCGVAVHAWP